MLSELEEKLDTATDELDKVCDELGKESEEQKVLQRERDDYELKIQDFEDARGALDASKHNFSDATKRYMESLADSDAVAMNLAQQEVVKAKKLLESIEQDLKERKRLSGTADPSSAELLDKKYKLMQDTHRLKDDISSIKSKLLVCSRVIRETVDIVTSQNFLSVEDECDLFVKSSEFQHAVLEMQSAMLAAIVCLVDEIALFGNLHDVNNSSRLIPKFLFRGIHGNLNGPFLTAPSRASELYTQMHFSALGDSYEGLFGSATIGGVAPFNRNNDEVKKNAKALEVLEKIHLLVKEYRAAVLKVKACGIECTI